MPYYVLYTEYVSQRLYMNTYDTRGFMGMILSRLSGCFFTDKRHTNLPSILAPILPVFAWFSWYENCDNTEYYRNGKQEGRIEPGD